MNYSNYLLKINNFYFPFLILLLLIIIKIRPIKQRTNSGAPMYKSVAVPKLITPAKLRAPITLIAAKPTSGGTILIGCGPFFSIVWILLKFC